MKSIHPFFEGYSFAPFVHRGGIENKSENTLDAFQYSSDLGFIFMETDVQITKDGEIVVFHDESLERVAGIKKNIVDLKLNELKEIPLLKGGFIPSLEELLSSFSNLRFNIDVKKDEAVNKTIEIINNFKAFDRICLASFSSQRLYKIRKLCGKKLCSSMGMTEIMRLYLNSLGLNFFIEESSCSQVPNSYFSIPVVTKKFIEKVHQNNRFIHVWTINNEKEMHRLINLGVDGLMTDVPSTLKKVLIERKMM